MLPDFARGRPDPRVLGYSESRAFAESPDRLRGGSGTPGGARRDAAGGRRQTAEGGAVARGRITTEEHFRTFSMDRTGREAARTACPVAVRSRPENDSGVGCRRGERLGVATHAAVRELDSVAGKRGGDGIVIGSWLRRKHVMKDVPDRWRLYRVLPG
jgi:hypothetical protein